MNEEPDNLKKQPGSTRHYFVAWLVLVGATFMILLITMLFGSGGPRSLTDWLAPALFLLVNSLIVATVVIGVWVVGRWLLCLRNLRWLLLAGGCVLGLIALFYAEEDWRGWHTWNRFQRAWEAKGQHFTLAGVVPPKVPDDENFALTPIVFTSYGHVLTREGKPIPDDKRDEHFVVRMRTPISLNAPAPTNCAGDRVKGTVTRLDCWQGYYRDVAGKPDAFPVPAQPQSPAADVLLALSNYDGVIEELRSACRLPYSRYPINYDSDSPWLIMLPHLAVLKSCAQCLQLRGSAHLQNGQPDKALDDVQLALQLTDKISNEPILISYLVRIAMVQFVLQPIWEGLTEHKWSDAQLTALEAGLAKLDFLAAWQLSMRSELGFQNDTMRLLRRHPGKLRELDIMRDPSGNPIDLGVPPGLLVHLIPAGWFYQNQYRCARVMEDYYIPAVDLTQRTFSPELAWCGEAVIKTEMKTASPFNRFERLLLPWLNTGASKFAYGTASVDLARTAIALERYRLAHGAYPESLDALAPQFIAQVRHDVIGGGPLKYRREADGSYALYSIGWNMKDDGGEAAFNKEGAVDIQNGDWIWRCRVKAG
jgi:tetratricopeptide (TPR) repeat protein